MSQKKKITRRPKKSASKPEYQQEILALLMDAKLHPTVEGIYQKLKKKFRSVQPATLQRNLRSLKAEGKIWELALSGNVSRFSAASHFHYHFVCNNCQNIYDLRIPPMRALDEKVMELTGFRILSHRLVFFGLCDSCKHKTLPPKP